MNSNFRDLTADFITGVGVPRNYAPNSEIEQAETSGWALGTTGTLTNAIPTGTPTFGSGASGNLSVTTTTTNPLRGARSLQLVSAAATTAGNMLHTSAIVIDQADQAKVLTFKFYYRATTNPSNANWSGTSSNSFGVACYDVTNSSWLPVAGNFSMTQSSGIGIATGTMQTNATTSSIRFCIYAANATSGAVTVDFDDIYLGPQTAPIGPVVTDWVSYTPTGAWSTNTTYTGKWRRVGDTMQIFGTVSLSGAPNAATNFSFNLPSGYTIDTTKLTSPSNPQQALGIARSVTATSTNYTAAIVYVSSTSVGAVSSGAGVVWSTTVPGTWANGDYATVEFQVPISGWSSNVQMSNDTDTRVVAFQANSTSTQSITSGAAATQITSWTPSVDTLGGWSSGSQQYVIPITGNYKFKFNVLFNNTTVGGPGTIHCRININGSDVLQDFTAAGGTATAYRSGTMEGIASVKAGDIIQFKVYQDTGTTLTLVSTGANATIERLSGPSVIAATDTVACRYTAASTAAIPNSATVFDFSTKDYDTTNSVTTGASWKFTSPISGIYSIYTSLDYTGAASASRTDTTIRKNGSTTIQTEFFTTSGATVQTARAFTQIRLLAGEYIDVTHHETVDGGTYSSAGQQITILRVGN